MAAVDSTRCVRCNCIWKRRPDIALARIPLGTPSVPVLEKGAVQPAWIPLSKIRKNQAERAMGRLLFERRTRTINRIAVYVIACLLGLITAIAAFDGAVS